MDEYYVYSVSEMTEYLSKIIENDPYLTNVWVYGEISNVRPRKGHIFFSLVDEGAKIECVFFGGDYMGLRLVEGRMALAEGSVKVYPPHGTYRFICSNIRYLDRTGLYQLRYETTLRKLLEEGLLSKPKKVIPRFPKRIGVITSRDSAALQDVLRTARERFFTGEIYLFHASVQGEDAKEELIRAIRLANEFDLDVVLIVRGGGSKEDLWVFNEEEVVREILKLRHPVITGIGHEIDRVLADLVADLSAHTPTAAAEYAFPDAMELVEGLEKLFERLKENVLERIELSGMTLEELREELIAAFEDRQNSLMGRLSDLKTKLLYLCKYHFSVNPILERRVKEAKERLKRSALVLGERRMESLDGLFRVLENLNPKKPLEKGFAVVMRDGKVVTNASSVVVGEELRVIFRDGERKVRVIG